jgi:hypothetical protein
MSKIPNSQITLSVYSQMSYTTQTTSAGSSWTSSADQGHAGETAATPTILISHSVISHNTRTISSNEPSLSSRRGIHKTIHLPPPSTEHEVPPALSTAALMKRAHELGQVDTPITPVEKLIPSAPINKRIRVRHSAKPVRCNHKLHALFPSNGGNISPRSPLAPHLMNTGPLASPISLFEKSQADSLPSPVSEKIFSSSDATPVSAIATD